MRGFTDIQRYRDTYHLKTQNEKSWGQISSAEQFLTVCEALGSVLSSEQQQQNDAIYAWVYIWNVLCKAIALSVFQVVLVL